MLQNLTAAVTEITKIVTRAEVEKGEIFNLKIDLTNTNNHRNILRLHRHHHPCQVKTSETETQEEIAAMVQHEDEDMINIHHERIEFLYNTKMHSQFTSSS
jgi:hypothetical protein